MSTQIFKPMAALLFAGAIALAQTIPPPPPDDAPAPSDAAQKAILAKITDAALKYRQGLPDFICSRMTRRSVDATGTSQKWRQIESVDEELTHTSHGDTSRPVTVNGKASNGSARAVEPRPELGDMLDWVFGPKAHPEFKWHSWVTLNGRKNYVFAYTVALENSQFTIGGKSPKIVAFSGLFYADVETANVTHLFVIAASPANYHLTNVTYDVIYEPVQIGDRKVPMPTKSDYHAKDVKSLIWNEVEFRRCRAADAGPFNKR